MAWSRDPGRYRGVTRAQAQRIRQRDNRTCQQCGRSGWQVDHIRNVAAGGTNDDSNLQVLCNQCHDTKTQQEAAAGRLARRERSRAYVEPHPGLIAQRPEGVGVHPRPRGTSGGTA